MVYTSIIKKLALFGGLIAVSAAAFVSFGTAPSALAESCTKGTKYTDFTGSYSGRDTMTVQTKNGVKLCNDVDVHFASFIAPANYNGNGFKNNPTAIPQSQYYIRTVTLKKGTTGKTTVTVKVPDDCTNYQIDAYIGPVQTKITTSEGFIGTNAIVGKLFQKLKSDCTVPKVETCDTSTGTIVKVDKGKENTYPYTTDLSKCKATVCDTQTGAVVTINKHEALSNPSRYVDQNDARCKDKVTKCDTKTKSIVTITREAAEADTARYVDQNSDVCTPTEIPSTGPAEIVSGIAGVGALAGSTSMYIRSRRALRK
jgi:hypothetical protein